MKLTKQDVKCLQVEYDNYCKEAYTAYKKDASLLKNYPYAVFDTAKMAAAESVFQWLTERSKDDRI